VIAAEACLTAASGPVGNLIAAEAGLTVAPGPVGNLMSCTFPISKFVQSVQVGNKVGTVLVLPVKLLPRMTANSGS
jgi:hypothetical protein